MSKRYSEIKKNGFTQKMEAEDPPEPSLPSSMMNFRIAEGTMLNDDEGGYSDRYSSYNPPYSNKRVESQAFSLHSSPLQSSMKRVSESPMTARMKVVKRSPPLPPFFY